MVWECYTCKRKYPIDYEPDYCECGGVLTRYVTIPIRRDTGHEAISPLAPSRTERDD